MPVHARTVRRASLAIGVSLALLSGPLVPTGAAAPVTAQAPTQAPTRAGADVTVQELHFAVRVGQGGAGGAGGAGGEAGEGTVCDVVGDLYLPAAASRRQRVPAVLTTHGFGGSKDDQAGLGRLMAERGYAVLAYSGLGFGGSTCRITLDDRAHDGRAGQQLVSYLGGKGGIAFLDAAHTEPAPRLQVVRRDRRAHDGRRHAHDPRVGMVGGSYGGGAQFAVAAVDPRVDTLVPIITWNDLSYSLAPNGTDQITGVSTETPGVAKLIWALGFSLLGLTGDLQNPGPAPDPLPCPNFVDFVCPALVSGATAGFVQPEHVAALRGRSVASYLRRIRVPVLLSQGQHDTLFNLNEAEATYRALQRQGTEVKMIWQSWGHSGGTVPGELDLDDPDPATQYLTGRVLRWFAHHLKDRRVGTGPEFAYFRDWVSYRGNAAPAYATSPAFPVGSRRSFRLSGDGRLTRGDVVDGAQQFVTPPAGLPTGIDEVDVLGGFIGEVPLVPADLPGTFAQWTSGELRSPVDVVGSPVLRLRVDAPSVAATQAAGAAGQLVIFAKMVDIAPDGSASLINGLEAPVRVPDAGKRFTVRLPGIVHRFAPGHRVGLLVSGGSVNYRGGVLPAAVTIASGVGGAKQTLTLPVVK